MDRIEVGEDILQLVAHGSPAEKILQAHQVHVDNETPNTGIYRDSITKRHLFQLLVAGVYYNHTSLVKQILESYCPVNLTNVFDSLIARGHTVSFPRHIPQPLIVAVEQGNKEMVALLLQYGADVHEEHIRMNADVLSAMDAACEKDDVDIMNCLRPYFKQSRDRHRKNLLHIACKRNAYKCAEVLLCEGEIQVNEVDTQGCTPLMYCVRHGSRFVYLLLQTEVDVNILAHQGTALHMLVFPHLRESNMEVNLKDFLVTVQLLLDRGADVSLMAGNGNTPLSWTLARAGIHPVASHLDCGLEEDEYATITMKAFEMILEASPTGINSVNNWLSMSTVMKNISELFTYLRNSFQDNFERSAVECAKMNHQLLKKLLEFGLDPNTPANCLTHIRVGLQDLTLLEAVLAELCILAKNACGQSVLKGTVFNKVGNTLLDIFQDFLSYGGRLRVDILYRALVRNHPCIWPFVHLYLLRSTQADYQHTVNELLNRLHTASRISAEDKDSIRESLPRVNSLKHLARLCVYERLGSEVCPVRISALCLPLTLKQFVAFQSELPQMSPDKPAVSVEMI